MTDEPDPGPSGVGPALRRTAPAIAYGLLLWGAGTLAALRLGGGHPGWAAAPIVVAGSVRSSTGPNALPLPPWTRWAWLLAEAALAATLGTRTLALWGAVRAWESAVGGKSRNPAKTRTFRAVRLAASQGVVAGLAFVIPVSAGSRLDPVWLLFCGAVTFGAVASALAPEVGPPTDPSPDTRSAPAARERRTAGSAVQILLTAAAVCALFLMPGLSPDWVPVIPVLGGVVLARRLGRETEPPDRVSFGAEIARFCVLLGIGMAAL
jgi:hypothetical protein